MTSTSETTSDRVLMDNRHTPCAVGLIKAARAMAELPGGTVMEIWSKDRFAPIEIPLWAEKDGHAVRDCGKQGPAGRKYFVFEVTKG
jgi:TusA-related sulfurtransferase